MSWPLSSDSRSAGVNPFHTVGIRAAHRFEGWRLPFFEGIRRLNIVMAVKQHMRSPSGAGAMANDQNIGCPAVSRRPLSKPNEDSRATSHCAALRHSGACAGSVEMLGMPEQLEQAFEAVIEIEVGPGEHLVESGHHSPLAALDTIPPPPCHMGHGDPARGATVSEATFLLYRDSLQAKEPVQRLMRLSRIGYQRWLVWRSQIDVYFFWEKRWFFVALLLGFVVMNLPPPQGLTHAGQTVLAMSLVATVLFVTEPIPLPTVPLLIIVGEIVLLGLNPSKVAQSLMTDLGAVHHGLADAGRRHRQAEARQADGLGDRSDDRHQCLLDQLRHHHGVRLLAAFIGEHTVAAMMLPVGVRLISLTLDDSAQGAQSCGGDPALDFLWLLDRLRSRRPRAARATPS